MFKIHWYKIIIVGDSGKKMTFSLPATKSSYVVSKLEKHLSTKMEKKVAIGEKDGIITVEGKRIAKIEKIIKLAKSPK